MFGINYYPTIKFNKTTVTGKTQYCGVLFQIVFHNFWIHFYSSQRLSKQQNFYPRCTPRNSAPQSRDTPPKRGVFSTSHLTCFSLLWEACSTNTLFQKCLQALYFVVSHFALIDLIGKEMFASLWSSPTDTGIASEKDWGINLLDERVSESGVNEDGSTWYRESGEDLGDNGYRCRWARMGGQSHDGASEWKETVCFRHLSSLILLDTM